MNHNPKRRNYVPLTAKSAAWIIIVQSVFNGATVAAFCAKTLQSSVDYTTLRVGVALAVTTEILDCSSLMLSACVWMSMHASGFWT
eukprot:CAMPEP_0118859428 /NCGR_PEP_ID=MMETSP1163-20130328/5683_1 /TAXON_ID=124430 /ORGANISM="Phaeomonas parva, Strain CCMP2877" /LENGTH=85 /DNA_ID=CAMNT_0006793019 /DNA_START=449 /DNA_END=702 /DNA_ORIENTATION=+